MPLIPIRFARRTAVTALLIVPLLLGCRTRLLVEDVSCATPGRFIDGIPFRVRETHTIRVMQWRPESKVKEGYFKEVFVQRRDFPNLEKVFALNYRAEAFADSKLELKYQPDNTIEKVEITGTPNAAGATALADQAKALGDAIAKFDETVQDRVDTLRDKERTRREKDVTDYQDVRALNEALDGFNLACLAYRVAKATGDAKNIAEAAAAVRTKMHDCNEKSVKLGFEPPFPNPASIDLDIQCAEKP